MYSQQLNKIHSTQLHSTVYLMHVENQLSCGLCGQVPRINTAFNNSSLTHLYGPLLVRQPTLGIFWDTVAVVPHAGVNRVQHCLTKHITTCTVQFLQRGRIACNAERCNTYSNSVCLSVCLSVCPSIRPSIRPSVRHTLVPYPDE